MFDRFATWQYRDDANCWDYVREYLLEYTNIPAHDLPKFGIHPSNKRKMTSAANRVVSTFRNTPPVDYAIACHYMGKVLYHVGVVVNGKVIHTGEKTGTVSEAIKSFERRASITKYKLHESLWQN